jgi:hypothetical protein
VGCLAQSLPKDGHPGLQPGSKGASPHLGRQLGLYPYPAIRTPTGHQSGLGTNRLNFGQLPYLMSFSGRKLSFRTRSQQTPTVMTGFRPMRNDLIHFLRRRQLPMVALRSRLATGMAYAFFPLVFRSLRGIAGRAIKPGLQLIDLLLQLGYCIRRLAQGILQNSGYKPELLEEVFSKSLEQSAWVPQDLGYTIFHEIPSPLGNFSPKLSNNLPPLRRGTERLPITFGKLILRNLWN